MSPHTQLPLMTQKCCYSKVM